tara:strand:+ start:50 stop:493 length:444 start_codon:yes stop_codon:yes gene_type:complete
MSEQSITNEGHHSGDLYKALMTLFSHPRTKYIINKLGLQEYQPRNAAGHGSDLRGGEKADQYAEQLEKLTPEQRQEWALLQLKAKEARDTAHYWIDKSKSFLANPDYNKITDEDYKEAERIDREIDWVENNLTNAAQTAYWNEKEEA